MPSRAKPSSIASSALDGAAPPAEESAAAEATPSGDADAPPSKLKTSSRLIFLGVIGGCVAAIPLIVVKMRRNHYELHYISWVVAGICVMLTIPLVMYEIGNHLSHFYEPRLQRLVIRIMWMPLVFGVNHWCALRFKDVELYFEALTGWYEAWVIYSFYCYLEAYLERGEPVGSLATSPRIVELEPHKHMIPCCCLPAWRMDNGDFVRRNKIGVLQYAVVQTFCTGVTFITQHARKYHDGELSPDWAYMYVTVAVNVSQMTALYCLVLFYHAMDEELKPIRPLPKFLCVKLVVFFSFWQSMVIAALVHWHVIREEDSWTTYTVEDVANGIQNFLMCIEMLFAAIAHGYAFPYADYVPPPGVDRPKFGDNVKHMLSCGDAVDDLVAIFGCSRAPEDDGKPGGDVEMGAPAAQLADVSAAAAAAEAAEKEAAERKERRRKRKAEKEAKAAADAAASAAGGKPAASAEEAPPAPPPAAAPSRQVTVVGGQAPSRQVTTTVFSEPMERQALPLIEVWADAATASLSGLFSAVGMPCSPQRAPTAGGIAADEPPPQPQPRVVEQPRRVRTSRSAAPAQS